MNENKTEVLDIKQFESGENTSYSPVIKELTPKQIKQIKFKKMICCRTPLIFPESLRRISITITWKISMQSTAMIADETGFIPAN